MNSEDKLDLSNESTLEKIASEIKTFIQKHKRQLMFAEGVHFAGSGSEREKGRE